MTLVKRRRQFLQSARNIQGGNVCKIISLATFAFAGVFYLMPRKRINDSADRRRRKSGGFNLDGIRAVIRHSNTPARKAIRGRTSSKESDGQFRKEKLSESHILQLDCGVCAEHSSQVNVVQEGQLVGCVATGFCCYRRCHVDSCVGKIG